MTLKKALLTGLASGGMLLGGAQAATIADGETQVIVTLDLDQFGLTASVSEGAELEFIPDDFSGDAQPVLQFDVTGRELNPGPSGQISHTGAVTLAADSASVTLANFLIDLDEGTIFADVDASNGTSVDGADVFTFEATIGEDSDDPFDQIDTSSLDLFYTETSLGVLNAVFTAEGTEDDLPLSTSSLFATATTDPAPVPVPAAALLFAPVAGGFIAARRRRKKA